MALRIPEVSLDFAQLFAQMLSELMPKVSIRILRVFQGIERNYESLPAVRTRSYFGD